AVKHFEEHSLHFEALAKSILGYLQSDKQLAPFIHFIKYRAKSTKRLREKLVKKSLEQEAGSRPLITASNLFRKINDLAGVRILHLHTNQINEMNHHIKRILDLNKIRIVEGPTVHCWDRDYENLFSKFGIGIQKDKKKDTPNESMYTSVHYI